MEQLIIKIPLYSMAIAGSLGLLYLSTYLLWIVTERVLKLFNVVRVIIDWKWHNGKCKECRKKDVYTPRINKEGAHK